MAYPTSWQGLLRTLLALLTCLATVLPFAEPARAEGEAPAWTIPSNEEICALLAERMAENGVGVVVGIVEPGGHRVVSYGRSGAADGRPLDGDAIFQIGSVTKVFTTLLLADMALKGEVRLDDPAARYLPEGVSMPRTGADITLADLATHMSGLPSMPTNFDLAAEPDPYEAYRVEDLWSFLSSYDPERAPGEYEYSNLGVSLLGRLLALEAGTDYETLLTERVLAPLGLTSTAITLTSEQEGRLAPGFDRNLEPVHTWEMKTLQASGSLRSSVNDLMTLLDAELGFTETPLSAAMAHQLAAVRRPASGTTQLLGWSERSFQGVTVIGHDGGKQGYRSAVLFDPDRKVGVVILSNARTDDSPIRLAVHLLTGLPLPPVSVAPQRSDVTLTPDQLDIFAGDYASEKTGLLRVARKGERLIVDQPGAGIVEYLPASATEFRSNIGPEVLIFETDAQGRVTGVEQRVGLQATRAERVN